MRLIDTRLEAIRDLLHNLVQVVAELVSSAAISIADPSCNLGLDAERQYERMNRLTRDLRKAIAVTSMRHAPFASDLRFLLGVSASLATLEHMGGCAKQVCQLASQISRRRLFPLLNLTHRGAGLSSKVLQQIETSERGAQVETLVAGHREIEEMYADVLCEIESFELDPRELEIQVLVASKLKEICDAAAKIADELAFYQFSDGMLAA